MTTTIETLRRKQQRIHELGLQQSALTERIEQAHKVVAAADEARAALVAKQLQHRELLADDFLGSGDPAGLKASEKEVTEAERNAKAAALLAEAAAAGAERLQREYADRAGQIRGLSADLPALLYAAAVEHVASMMEEYKAAALALGEVFARWQGAALVADGFADLQAEPRRLPILGGPVDSFALRVPMNMDVAPEDFEFGIGSQIDAALREARAFIESEDE